MKNYFEEMHDIMIKMGSVKNLTPQQFAKFEECFDTLSKQFLDTKKGQDFEDALDWFAIVMFGIAIGLQK